MTDKNKKLTRKEFIQRTSRAIIGAGLIGRAQSDNLPVKSNLEKCSLGKTGISMTKLGFGAPRTQEASLIKYAIDNGITFIDTGRGYANGKNEELVGSVIKGMRKDLVVQSKFRLSFPDGGTNHNSRKINDGLRETFWKSLHESLTALMTDYIDILLFHGAEDENLLFHETVLELFRKAKEQGKVRASGFSAHVNQADLIKKAIEVPSYDAAMIAFNHSGGYEHSRSSRRGSWDQEELIKVLKIATGKGIGIIAMKTCSGGHFSPDDNTSPSFPHALKWVLDQEYIHAAAVAMANFTEVNEHLAVLKA
jgi:hypothetical protein